MHLSSGGAYDCTGGYIYQYYGIHYETPTEELEMSAGDYIKLIQNPRHYFEHPLHFIEPESTLYYHLGEHFTLPVARIDDITIYFRHYPTPQEAYVKWRRRSSRINYDKLFFLMTESPTATLNEIELFSHYLKNNDIHGVLLVQGDSNSFAVKHGDNVPVIDKVLQWRPDIIIKAIDWKKELSKL